MFTAITGAVDRRGDRRLGDGEVGDVERGLGGVDVLLVGGDVRRGRGLRRAGRTAAARTRPAAGRAADPARGAAEATAAGCGAPVVLASGRSGRWPESLSPVDVGLSSWWWLVVRRRTRRWSTAMVVARVVVGGLGGRRHGGGRRGGVVGPAAGAASPAPTRRRPDRPARRFTLSCLDTTVFSAVWQALTADDTADGIRVCRGSTPIAEHTDVAESRALAASEIADVDVVLGRGDRLLRAAARPSGGVGRWQEREAPGSRPPGTARTIEPSGAADRERADVLAGDRLGEDRAGPCPARPPSTGRSPAGRRCRRWASCWPVVTVSPSATSTVVTVPDVGEGDVGLGDRLDRGDAIERGRDLLLARRCEAVHGSGFEPVVWATARPPPAISTSTTAAVTVRRMRRRRRYALLVISSGNSEATRWRWLELTERFLTRCAGRRSAPGGRRGMRGRHRRRCRWRWPWRSRPTDAGTDSSTSVSETFGRIDRTGDADGDAEQAAGEAEDRGLDEELAADEPRADRRAPCAGRSRGSAR